MATAKLVYGAIPPAAAPWTPGDHVYTGVGNGRIRLLPVIEEIKIGPKHSHGPHLPEE